MRILAPRQASTHTNTPLPPPNNKSAITETLAAITPHLTIFVRAIISNALKERNSVSLPTTTKSIYKTNLRKKRVLTQTYSIYWRRSSGKGIRISSLQTTQRIFSLQTIWNKVLLITPRLLMVTKVKIKAFALLLRLLSRRRSRGYRKFLLIQAIRFKGSRVVAIKES